MLELGPGGDIIRALGWLRLGLIAALLIAAVWIPRRRWIKALCVTLALLITVVPMWLQRQENKRIDDQIRARYEAAKAVFDERCKTAGMTIYKTVEDVEGVFLTDMKPGDLRTRNKNLSDPNWPDTGLPNESGGDGYISTFLDWEYRSKSDNQRGYLNSNNSTQSDILVFPGYAFVDVKGSDSRITRYQLNMQEGPPLRSGFDESIVQNPTRYAINRTNHIDPADRVHWVAGVTITVTDTQTNEVLGTSTWYSFEPGLGSTAGFRSPWLQARTCPEMRGSPNRYPTRFFVDQALKPKPH